MEKLKIIYDTDPGVDDAMALLLLARHPRIELVGVTTVFGNADIATTTRNALYLKKSRCRAGGAGSRPAAGGRTGRAADLCPRHERVGDIVLPTITEGADRRVGTPADH